MNAYAQFSKGSNDTFLKKAYKICCEINPSNPLAVIEALPELIEALKNIVSINGVGYGTNVVQFVTDLQPLVADADFIIEQATGK